MAGVIEPSRDTHGYWPQGDFTVSKGRTFKGSRKQHGKGISWRINTSNANMHRQKILSNIKQSLPILQGKNCTSITSTSKGNSTSNTCKELFNMKDFKTHHTITAACYQFNSSTRTVNEQYMNSAFDFSQLHYVLRLATTAPVKPKGFLMTPSPLTITANTPRAHQSTHFGDLRLALSFRKWIKDCCHPGWHYVAYVCQASHWETNSLPFYYPPTRPTSTNNIKQC